MDTQEPGSQRRNPAGWIILGVVLLADAGLAYWYWSEHQGASSYNAAGLNLSEAPKPDVVPNIPAKASPPAAKPLPAAAGPAAKPPPSPSRQTPARPAAFPTRVAQRPEWAQAAASFMRLAQLPKYRRSPVLRAWAKDFAAYPDLRTIGVKFARDHDLLFFTVAVLRSTNFAKMLRKYGPSPDVKNFFMDLMSSPGVAASSRALVEDRSVMNSIKDLTIPGLPPLGQLMASGAQSQTPQANDAALRKFMQEQQRRSRQ